MRYLLLRLVFSFSSIVRYLSMLRLIQHPQRQNRQLVLFVVISLLPNHGMLSNHVTLSARIIIKIV